MWPRFHEAVVCLNDHLFAHSPSQPSMWRVWSTSSHGLFTPCMKWKCASILPHGHIFIISRYRCTIMDLLVFLLRSKKIQITSARQFKTFRALSQVHMFVAKNCLDASLGHSRNTQDWVCDACRPVVNHDFLTTLSSQTHSLSRSQSPLLFRLLSSRQLGWPVESALQESDVRYTRVRRRQDFCPIEILLCWV